MDRTDLDHRSCASEQEWCAFLDGTLEPDRRNAMEQCLEQCEICGDLLETLSGAAALRETLGDESAATAVTTDLRFLQPSDDASSLGRLGQYEVREEISRGGMGVIYKAWDTEMTRTSDQGHAA